MKCSDCKWHTRNAWPSAEVLWRCLLSQHRFFNSDFSLEHECDAPEMKLWLEQEQQNYPPKSPMGAALTYLDNNWDSLQHFLEDPHVRLDNNISEQALRIVALGRHNFMFVGNDDAGDRLAVLQSLVSSCELNGVNPEAYLADVLIRIQDHPASEIDELLPDRWQPADTS